MEQRPPQSNLLRYATVGIEFLLVFLLLFFLGWQVDRWVVWSRPAFSVLGAIAGFSLAFYRIAKQGWGILTGGRGDRRKGGPEDRDDQG